MRRIVLLLLLISITFSLKEDWIYIVGVHGESGVLARLRLKIVDGSGNVYVDTFPLTQVDTQASARIAKEVACEILNVNCSRYDFLYKIEGESEIVGGPSAGAAMTVLAMALLSNTSIRKDVIVTGTISPDWSVGPVGGIYYKYLAAKNVSKIFLIPYGEKTEEIEEIEDPNTRIIEVKDILEVFYYFTGKKIEFGKKRISMEKLKEMLKKTSEKLCEKAEVYEYLGEHKSWYLERAKELMRKEKYYSAASYCVRAIRDAYKEYLIRYENIVEEIERMNRTIQELKKLKINYSDKELELVFIFYDRLYSAEEFLKEGVENRDLDAIATAKAKLISAKSWLECIEGGNKTFDMRRYKNSAKEILERAKINVLYASTFINNMIIAEAERKLSKAEEAFKEGNYVETIFYAKESEALAELSLELLENKEKLYKKYDELSTKKLEIEIGRGYYPILALAYKEYGEILKEEDIDMAIYFLKLSMKYSSLPSEIREENAPVEFRMVERSVIEENPWTVFVLATLGLLTLTFYFLSKSI